MTRLSRERKCYIYCLCVVLALVCAFCMLLPHFHECEGMLYPVSVLLSLQECLWFCVSVSLVTIVTAMVLYGNQLPGGRFVYALDEPAVSELSLLCTQYLCAWNTYYVKSGTDERGKIVPGYYLYPTDAIYLITTEGAQYNYGYQEGFFDSIIAKIDAVDPEAFTDLVANVRGAEALAKKLRLSWKRKLCL